MITEKIINNILSQVRIYLVNHCRRYGIKATVSKDNEHLKITTDKGIELFPVVWLRDNCTCESCFNINSQSRIINWNDFKINANIENVKVINDNLEITWNDKHYSVYKYDWLKSRSFLKEYQQKYLSDIYKPPRILWGKKGFWRVFNCYDYNEILTNDAMFYKCLMNLAVYGVVLIENAPTNENECRKIVNKIGFGKRTHYGAEYHVKIKQNANNVAYIPRLLQLHTDLPFYRYKPGTIFLHCIEQTKGKGGENLLVDGFYVAEKLRIEKKDVFDTLSKTLVNWFDEGVDDQMHFNKVYRAPVICLNSKGEIESINHNIARRDSYFSTDIKNVKTWYKSLKIFVEEINKYVSEFKLQPGQILAFDNTRLLHGRYSYKDTVNTQRFLVGIYVDWDEIYSKIRVLKKSLNN